MSIEIDKKLLRKAWFGAVDAELEESLMRTLPLARIGYNPTYDGEWIKNQNPAAGYYGFGTGVAYQGAGIGVVGTLRASARLKISVDTFHYMFFYEPVKADYDNYQGIDARDGAVHYARSRSGGAQTATNIDPQDWTTEHEFLILHQKDVTDVYFYIDGAEEAHHTTNISAQPFEILCGEPNGQPRDVYLKYPYGIGIKIDLTP